MGKKIVSSFILCILMFSIFSIASSIQSAKACENPPGYIPPGENVAVTLPDPRVGLVFDLVTTRGWANAIVMTMYPPPPAPPGETDTVASDTLPPSGFVGPVWQITVTATFSGKVIVRIDYGTGASPTQLLQNDIVPGDVNMDGKVNWKDLCIILKALGSSPGSPRWNPNCDLNGDNKITLKDLCIAFEHLGQQSVWKDITTRVDYENHVIYGITDHFVYVVPDPAIFGVR